MRKNLTTVLIFLAAFTSYKASCAQEVVINLDKGLTSQTQFVGEGEKTIKVTLKNVPPSLASQYDIVPIQSAVTIEPLTKPTKQNSASGTARVVVEDSDSGSPCSSSADNNFLNDIKIATSPAQVAAAFLKHAPNNISDECLVEIETRTQLTTTVKLLAGYELTLQVINAGNDVASATFKRTKNEWLTHVGFSFLDNKSTSYFSAPESVMTDDGEQTVYRVAEQFNQDSIAYAASALFTYPIGPLPLIESSHAEWGWTAGLGTDANSVSVIFGPSVIIQRNILINLGAVVQEFDDLDGTYQVGQLIGEDAIDSSTLAKRGYELTWGITIGFNFGS